MIEGASAANLTPSPEESDAAIPPATAGRGPVVSTTLGIGVSMAALAIAAFLPLFNSNPYILGVVILIFIYTVVTESWNFVLGMAGILTFAQMAFFTVGGYSAAILNLQIGLSPWVTTLIGALVAVVASLIVGLPALRLRGVYVVLLTLAFQSLLMIMIQTDQSGYTGGAYGLSGIASYLPMSMGFKQQLIGTYYLALALVTIVSILLFLVIRSPLGLAVKALRDAEEVAANRGISRAYYKMVAFAISAFFTGLAGAFYAHYFTIITTDQLDFGLTMNLMAMIVIGGWGSFAGPIVGTVLLSILSELLQGISQYRLVIMGAILVVTIVVAPGGIVGLVNTVLERVQGLGRRRRPSRAGTQAAGD